MTPDVALIPARRPHTRPTGTGRPPWAGELTPRQMDVLELMAEGLSTPAIGARLHIGFACARNHKSALFDRLGVHTSAEALAVAYRRGLLSPDPDIVEAAALVRAAAPGYRLALVPWDGGPS